MNVVQTAIQVANDPSNSGNGYTLVLSLSTGPGVEAEVVDVDDETLVCDVLRPAGHAGGVDRKRTYINIAHVVAARVKWD